MRLNFKVATEFVLIREVKQLSLNREQGIGNRYGGNRYGGEDTIIFNLEIIKNHYYDQVNYSNYYTGKVHSYSLSGTGNRKKEK